MHNYGIDTTTAGFADRQAVTNPDQSALVDRDRQLDWSEVKRASDELAAGLLERVDSGAVIFSQLYNCVELYLLRLACEKAGVRIVTAPSRFRGNELAPMFDALDIKLAIVPGEYRGHDYVDMVEGIDQGDTVRWVISLDSTGDESFDRLYGDPDDHRFEETAHGTKDVCQLATTSGSTSGPDCIEVPIVARLRTALAHIRRFGIDGDDSIGVITPLITGNADALGYHGAPQIGATVVLVERFDPSTVADWIEDRITVLPSVTTTTTKLVDHIQRESRDLSLSTIVNHASALTVALGERAADMFDCEVHQAFGAMDFGGISATSVDDSQADRLRTVGRPLNGNKVRLATDDGIFVNTSGEIGMLMARGAHQVGPSILGNTVETLESYTAIRDRAKFDEMGRIVLIGREDDAINRGGRIIYPKEIEETLSEYPQIAEVVVSGLPDDTFGQRVGAFVIPKPGNSIAFEDVVEFLRERDVAPYKLPERVVEVSDLPRVPAGHKVDRNALVEEYF